MTDTPDDSSAEQAEKTSRKRLTSEEWREIEVHWEYGTMTTKEIKEKFGITASALTQHFANLAAKGRTIVRNAKKSELAKKTAAAVTGAIAGSTGARVVSEFNEKMRERIEQTKESLFRQSQFNAILFGRLQKEIADGTRSIDSCTNELKALRHAEAFLKTSRENRYAVLDIEHDIDEQDLPTLVFEDLTEREIRDFQRSSDEEVDLNDLVDDPEDENGVVVEGDE